MTIESGTLCRIARCPDMPRMVGLMCTTNGVPEYRPLMRPTGVVERVLAVKITAPWLPIATRPWAISVALLDPVVGPQAEAEIKAERGEVPFKPFGPYSKRNWPWPS